MKQLTILGSTGSIGDSTLAVAARNPHLFSIKALSGGNNVDRMLAQCLRFRPVFASMENETAAKLLREKLRALGGSTEVMAGEKAACELAALDDVDIVMAAIVGAAGLLPTMSAIQAGKTVLLANKESLVTCGRLFMDAVRLSQAQLLPVDSEHSALFQSLPIAVQKQLGQVSLQDHGVETLVLTGSGGPFLELPLHSLHTVTPEQACAHPNWSMGRKISVDSATMMNKGLEYIEARWIFNATQAQIEVLLHPQSVIHSMVRYIDGSVLAQLGSPDMRSPIAYAMAWPDRIDAGSPRLDFSKTSSLTFSEPDFKRYPCLKLAIDAQDQGQAATTILNATNEIAVSAFLNKQIKFTDIFSLNDNMLSSFQRSEPKNLSDVIDIDHCARKEAKARLTLFSRY